MALTITPPGNASQPPADLRELEGFSAAFDAHADAIFRYAAVRVGADAALDVVSETFATAFTNRSSFDPARGAARPWLYGIAANVLARHRAAEARWLERCAAAAALEGDGEQGAATTPDAAIDARMLRPRLAAALAQLPPDERDVILLHTVAELPHEEIARALGIRRGTAKTRLSRGMQRLRAILHDLDPAAAAHHEGARS